jgi:2'-phosphotransferase
MADVLVMPSIARQRATVESILQVVEESDKQRYAVTKIDGELYIRANQGHSIEVSVKPAHCFFLLLFGFCCFGLAIFLTHQKIKVKDLDLKRITNPAEYPVVVHGTYMKNWESIQRTGLNRMGRKHIHFAKGEYGSENVISGETFLPLSLLFWLELMPIFAQG